MTNYIVQVWNIAGVPQGDSFIVSCHKDVRPHHVLMDRLEALNIEHWHIDFVTRPVGVYSGSVEEIEEQVLEEEMAEEFEAWAEWLEPNATY